MPTINLEKSDLDLYLNKKVSMSELQELFRVIGIDADIQKNSISAEITPNRPDMLSVVGLARTINLYQGSKRREYKAKKGSGKVKILPSAKKVRPHTRCAIIRDISFTDNKIKEVIDIQEKLHVTFGRRRKKLAIGIYPLEKIHLPITFGAENPKKIVFRPLESKQEMNALELLQKNPTGQAYKHLLEGYKEYPVFRDAKGDVLSVPPIINNHETGKINEETNDVFIECSGHQEQPLEEALTMIVCALIDMGGTAETMSVEYNNKKVVSPQLNNKTMKINQEYVCERAGIPKKQLGSSLKKMGLTINNNIVTIPAFRTDFLHEVDVAEEAAIGYGYDNIKPTIPDVYTTGGLSKEWTQQENIRDVLAGMGNIETLSYYLTNEGVPLTNPLTNEYSHLRNNIINNLLSILEKNTHNTYPQNIFEIGPTFHIDKKRETRVREENSLAVLYCGEDEDYTTAKKTLETLQQALGWNIKYAETDDKRFIPGRCAKITGDIQGIIGEIHPEELTKRGIQFPTSGFEVIINT